MNAKKWGLIGLIVVLLTTYNLAQPDLRAMRTTDQKKPGTQKPERYGPSMLWLDRLRKAQQGDDSNIVKLDFKMLSSMMIAGLASGFKSQVANLLWMKSDEYWHKGLATRQVSVMEIVVTLDPQFIDAWSTAGWHWAYNIYADIELSPKYKNNPKVMREKQDTAIKTGLDYLHRGAELNPDTYRLWFEEAWTWAEKWGSYDEKTVELLRIARKQPDARAIEREVQTASGRTETKKIPGVGLDTVGLTIGHIYESRPDIDKALDHWASMLKATPQERELLGAAGQFWGRYGSNYHMIGELYQSSPEMQAQIKRLVPDVERLIQSQAMRTKLEERGGTPLGAYITISARYVPAWNLMKQGKLQEARKTIIGVMNAAPRYHLQGLPTFAKVLELRGDSPQAIQKQLEQLRTAEKTATQDIGLHFLATLYEKSAAQEQNATQKKALMQKAYETWYRARLRNELDFYAKRNTYRLEGEYGFKVPQAIVEQVQKSRQTGNVNAAPPPNVGGRDLGPGDGGHGGHEGHDHDEHPREIPDQLD